jgi:uncharacterized protein (DUF1786 family)
MHILAVDIGTGTQDILLLDTEKEVENSLKMVMPSPTVLVAGALRRATAEGRAVLLTGVMMGGGPCAWAAEEHLRAGYPLYATPDAARTFNDDLEEVRRMGVEVVSEDEAGALQDVTRLEMVDFDYPAIARAFASMGVRLEPQALAVAVFDHGNAPPGYSDRRFRFDYLAERIAPPACTLWAERSTELTPKPQDKACGAGTSESNRLTAFAFLADQVPQRMTRMQAVVRSAPGGGIPLLLMDTAPAAVLGALEDPQVGGRRPVFVVNIGNFHTLAFRLGVNGIEGLFEHHTGEINRAKLEAYLEKLANGTLRHEEVFNDMGHGALLLDTRPVPLEFLAVTGPRRRLLRGSRLRPYTAVPYGDTMLAGCYGLVRAFADLVPEYREPIERALAN